MSAGTPTPPVVQFNIILPVGSPAIKKTIHSAIIIAPAYWWTDRRPLKLKTQKKPGFTPGFLDSYLCSY